jgi:hypothetical protein
MGAMNMDRFVIEDMAARFGATLPEPGSSPTQFRSRVPVPGQQTEDDPILDLLERWGMVKGGLPDGTGYFVTCPWESDHTQRDDTGTAYWPGGGFNCYHGHCSGKDRGSLRAWCDERLDEESGGLVTSVASLAFPAVPGYEPAPAPAQGTVIAPGAVQDLLGAFLEDLAWVEVDGKFWSRASGHMSAHFSIEIAWFNRLRDVLPRTRTRTGEAGQPMSVIAWFKGTQDTRKTVVSRLVYWPGQDIVFRDRDTGTWLGNAWRPSRAISSSRISGSRASNLMVRPWLDLVWRVFRAEGPRTVVRVLDWFALVVGDPGTKPGWHLVVQGDQGVGKDLLIQPVIAGVGSENTGRADALDLLSQFNSYAAKRLVVLNELKQVSGRDQYQRLKAMTDSTQAWLAINAKYRAVYHARNVSAFYVTTNDMDALAMDHDDRRFLVTLSTADAATWPGEEIARLRAWLGDEDGDGTQAVVAWLGQRWDRMTVARRAVLFGRAPGTAGKATMILAADPVRAWTHEQIETGRWPDLMSSEDINRAYQDAVRQNVFRYPVTSHRWGRLLRELGGGKVMGGEPVVLLNGQRSRLWAVREPKRFTHFGGTQLARAYAGGAVRTSVLNADVIVLPVNHTPNTDDETECDDENPF